MALRCFSQLFYKGGGLCLEEGEIEILEKTEFNIMGDLLRNIYNASDESCSVKSCSSISSWSWKIGIETDLVTLFRD